MTTAVQLSVVTLFRRTWFRRLVGVPDFLPGTKLERLNLKIDSSIRSQPKILATQVSKKSMRDKAVGA